MSPDAPLSSAGSASGPDRPDAARRLVSEAARSAILLEPRELLPHLVRAAADLVGADASAIGLVETAGTGLDAVTVHGLSDAIFEPGPAAVVETWLAGLVEDPTPRVVEDLERETDGIGCEQARSEGLRSLAVAPLRSRERIIGALAVFTRAPRRYEEADVARLTEFASLAAIAIENARLQVATARREDELRALRLATHAVLTELDLDIVLERIVDEAARIAGTSHVKLLLVDRATSILRAAAIRGTSMPPGAALPLGIGLSGIVAVTGHPQFVADTPADPRNPFAEADRALGIVTYLGLPIKLRDEVLGVLSFNTTHPRAYRDDEIAYLASFADQAAIALDTARRYQDERVRATRLRALTRLNQSVASSLESEQALNGIAGAAAELMNAYLATIWIADATAGALEARAFSDEGIAADLPVRRLAFGEAAPGWVAAHRRPLEVRDVFADPRLRLKDWFRRHGVTSYLGLPIVYKDSLIGVLSLLGGQPFRFGPDEQELLESFVAHAAATLENARLFDEARRRRLQAERLSDLGRIVSQSLDRQEVAQRIVDCARELFGAAAARLLRLDPDSGSLSSVAVAGGAAVDADPVFAATGVVGRATREGRPIATGDLLDDERVGSTPEMRAHLAGNPDRALLAVPLVVHNRTTGALAIRDRTGRFFGVDEIRLAQAVAERAALALENARLYAETHARLERTQRLAQLSQLVTTSLDFRRVLDFVAEAALDLLRGDLARIWVVDDEAGVARLAALRVRQGEVYPMSAPELPLDRGLVGWVIQERTKRSSPSLPDDPLHLQEEWSLVEGYVSQLAVPLVAGERALGAVVVLTRTHRRFSQEDEELLEIFAAQAATALANARLYEQAQQAYEELSRTQEQLTQSQKMEAIGRLAGGIAHDFNNLLTIICGRGELLAAGLPEDHPLRRHVDLVLHTAERATDLTKQLLAFSRRQVLQPRVLDLNAVVATVGGMLERVIGEDITLALVRDPALLSVKADPAQLEQVIMNLALNAREAMPKGGRLTLETGNIEVDASFFPGPAARRGGRYVVLAVRDNGPGMDAETMAHIFEPFFTTKERGQGAGLGLATVYGIVEQSDGAIMVESEMGQGTTFRIYLPPVLPLEETPADAVAPPAPENAAPGMETILLVEDQDEVRTLAREILELNGYTVLPASSGMEALILNEHHREPIHLILTDVVMPWMNGREVAGVISRSRPGTKILYMSGYTDDAIGERGVLDAGTDYLAKPFTASTLAAKVRQVLDTPPRG
jgi:GAF domain-containing protein/CheY-like chemotaxis protein